MAYLGIMFAALSGICNGLFTAPMKSERRWAWETIWFVFIITSCIVMPWCILLIYTPAWRIIFFNAPSQAIAVAVTFGFFWGFGAICFGRCVEVLGVSLANTLIIGLSAALGSLVPLAISGIAHIGRREYFLFTGVLAFLIGVALCGRAGWLRDGDTERAGPVVTARPVLLRGFFFSVIAGIMSAIFNIGYVMAMPIANHGVTLGYSRFASTNCIWLLMLGAGSLPNIFYCGYLMHRNHTGNSLLVYRTYGSWLRSLSMGLLWGGSIFLYGAATPRLGKLGPSLGWPISLAVGLLVANLMGVVMNEWQYTDRRVTRTMASGLVTLLMAIILCALSSKVDS
jgi:L-rhamnose-H+ transport protein